MRQSQVRFIRQQGFSNPDPDTQLYAALMFQPRIIGGLVVVGMLLQTPWIFLTLSAVLWWSTFFPARNPFDALYNALMARPRGFRPLSGAPTPRRFAQSMAATFGLAIGVALLVDARRTAWVCDGLLAAAVAAVVFGRFCAGSSLYEILRKLSSGDHSVRVSSQHGC